MHAHVGSSIKEEMCHVRDHRAALAMYQGVTCGPEAVATAAQELVAGEVTFIRFAVGDHPKEGGRIHDYVTVGLARYGPAKTEALDRRRFRCRRSVVLHLLPRQRHRCRPRPPGRAPDLQPGPPRHLDLQAENPGERTLR